MPHIPEEELHAYLDQALVRLRCVEIESHLAECTPCRETRDEIAALRDRTTAMLARLAPRRTTAPPLADLRHRAALRASQRVRMRQRAAWAASIVLALGVGWGASSLVQLSSGPTLATRVPASQPAAADAPAQVPASETIQAVSEPPAIQASEPAVSPQPVPVTRRPATRRLSRPADGARSGQLANVGGITKDGQLELGGVWRNLSWDGAKAQAGETLARIDGLPVTEVQTQTGDSGRRPVMVVAQQLASGEVVRTIEGPVSDVSALLGTRPGAGEASDSAGAVAPAPAGRPGLGSTLAFRHGDRMFAVTGSLPSDSLRAMMRRLNLMMGVR
jgi:hypothetical protein